MFGRVQTFGKDNTADFAAGSKAAAHFATLAQVITELDTAKAGQDGGTATARAAEVRPAAPHAQRRDAPRSGARAEE